MDNGVHWKTINTGLPITQFRMFAVAGENLYAGTATDGILFPPALGGVIIGK